MITLKTTITAILLIILGGIAHAESSLNYEQTVRGRVIDQDSKTPIPGANVIILDSNPIQGASTDYDGYFRIEKVPVGRVSIQISCLGFETKTIPNIVVGSGKEIVLNIEITESIVRLDDITIKAQRDKQEALNEMAIVSAKVFTVEETKRYAGSFNDPARMVAGFAGVVGDPSGENSIIVRGNSPKGILWQLEGVEIPNPNHFANEGYSGGPINALNSAMLDNSDFYSGAFAPEYGNAYSGVFDMKLRSGNNEKREYSFSGGALGFEGTVEGPFKKGYAGSYLINYRYSSLAVLDNLGLVDFYGIPKYQDLSFKFNLPAGKVGNFSIFGLGGKSNIGQESYDLHNEDYVLEKAYFEANLGIVGLTHTIPLSNKVYIKNSFTLTGTQNNTSYEPRDSNANFYEAFRDKFVNTTARAATCVNYKISAKHRVKAGISYTDMGYSLFSEYDEEPDGIYTKEQDADGTAGKVQSYVNWKYRLNEQLTLVSGIHYLQFLQNNSSNIEPRLGLEYQMNSIQAFTFGFGMHSSIESLATYQALVFNEANGAYTTPNTNLDLHKAMHFVAGYKHQFSENLYLKSEMYYQHLYDVPVENDPTSPFVFANQMGGFVNTDLVNEGTGRNYGLELTLERFYSNRFYYLITTSLYDSKFTAMDDVLRNSRYNGNYAFNVLMGKEFVIGDASKNRTIGINGKFSAFGGGYYTPLDLEQSIIDDEGVYPLEGYNGKRADEVFKLDLAATYRVDRKNTTHEFKIDIQNITNNQAVIQSYYDSEAKAEEYVYQWSIFPNIIYTIQF